MTSTRPAGIGAARRRRTPSGYGRPQALQRDVGTSAGGPLVRSNIFPVQDTDDAPARSGATCEALAQAGALVVRCLGH